MKKLLAMVLALVMTLSLAVSANAAFEDAKDINATYAEAVDVLAGMKVFQGYDNGKTFKPQGDITRAEVAAIVYRIYTADVKDSYVKNYETYNKFSDMAGAGWAKGYIGYCANAALVKGYPNGTFLPSGKVTGYEVLAMILRAVGYDKNNEFTGADWALHVAQIAEQNKILKNVKGIDLSAPASRELVAELLFQAIQVPTVTYTAAFGYQDVSLTADKKTDKYVKANSSLGYKNFKLVSGGDSDNWGRPVTVWAKDANDNGEYDVKKDTTVYATIVATPDAAFHVATSQCDICEALGEKKEAKIVEAYVNGVDDSAAAKALLETYKATATKAMVGAQGEQIEFYEVKDGYRLVVIDTYLAQVSSVVEGKTDSKNHVTRDAHLVLDVYKSAKNTAATYYVKGNDFAEDEWILVNVNESTSTDVQVKMTRTTNGTAKYEYLVEVVGKADSFEGAQSKVWVSANKHTIDSKDYMDACKFYKDAAGVEGTVNYTWFLDQFGNVIGNAAIDNSNYAVLKDLIWVVGKPGYAEATLVFMDGTEETVKVDQIDGLNGTNGFTGSFASTHDNAEPEMENTASNVSFEAKKALVASDSKYNDGYEGLALYLVEYNKDGTVNLQGYDKKVNDSDVLFVEYAKEATIKTNTGIIADKSGKKLTSLDNNTKFIVRETNDKDEYVYNAEYTLKDLPDYAAQSVEVFYTLDSTGKFANRVYIKNATDESAFGEYIFVPSYDDNSKAFIGRVTGEYDTWEADVYVDGVMQTIRTNKDVADKLLAGEGKLFRVTWEKDNASTSKIYGFVKSVVLVNEANDLDTWQDKKDLADYVTESTVNKDGDTLSADHLSWRTDAATFVTANGSEIKDLNGIDFDEQGVWVISDSSKAEGRAKVVYVGEKLGTDTGLIVTVDAAKGTVDGTKFTSAAGVTEATLNFAATDKKASVSPASATVTSSDNSLVAVTVTSEVGTTKSYSITREWTPAPEVTTAKVNDLVVKVDGTKISTAESTVYKNLADAVKNATEVSLASVNNATVSIEGGAHWVQGEVCGNSDIALASTANGQTHGQNTDSVTNANIASNTYIVVGVGVDGVNHYIAYVIK